LANVSEDEARAWRLTPVDLDSRGEPYLIEADPGAVLTGHFFAHKGQEMGYLISGRMSLRINSMPQHLFAGDLIHLAAETPTQWSNPGPETARLLWIKFR
jgi:quercetin dioxygenase-like cupin family protein